MKMVLAMAVLAVLGVTSNAWAAPVNQQGVYLGAGLTQVNFKQAGYERISPDDASLLGGYMFNKFISVQGRVGIGIASDSIDFHYGGTTSRVKLKVKSYYAGFLTGTLPINKFFDIYGLAGYSKVSFDLDIAAAGHFAGTRVHADGFSYGGGSKASLGQRTDISLDWVRLLSRDDYHADAISLAVRYHF